MAATCSSVFEKTGKEFALSTGQMRKIIKDFHLEMERGLCGRKSTLKMLPAYVDRPTGDEKGEFIALDLGGTNFRVLELKLKGSGNIADPKVMKFAIKKTLMTGEGKKLFAFFASSVRKFLQEKKMYTATGLDLGFTFSFPVRQESVASGNLVVWTKGFTARGVVGRDVVQLLRDALAREGLDGIRVVALANDTVGTLMTRSYGDPCCDVGVIIGTGTNACYVERIKNIKKWKAGGCPSLHGSGRMIINMEWGNFNKLKMTRYDRQLDAGSENPGEQILEKMVSGMYLGEITRRVLADLAGCGILFRGIAHDGLDVPQSFKSEFITDIEADSSKDLTATAKVLKDIGIRGSTVADRRIVREACEMVSVRAARISAAAIAAVVTKMDPALSKVHTVAIDGSVYEKHPNFSAALAVALTELFNRKAGRIRVVLSKDGSGKGAAIIAAVAATENISSGARK